MGLFDFFKRNKAEKIDPSAVKISLDEDSIVINGTSVDIPTHIDVLKRLLGKPREVVCLKEDTSKNSAEVNRIIEQNLTTRRVNYAWDKLGLYCYTKNGSVVSTIGIRLNKGDICPKHFPTEFFKGEVTVKGMHWFEAAKTLPNLDAEMDFFTTLGLGLYSVIIEYVDYEQEASARTEKDFTEIEIQLNRHN